MEIGSSIPQTKKNVEDLQERYDQLKAFYELQSKFQSLKETTMDELCDYWLDAFVDSSLTGRGRSSMKVLLKQHTLERIKEAIDITAAKGIRQEKEGRFRYMCGVLKNLKNQEPMKSYG